ncbi:MAG: PAS domain S-box protein, partial [Chloroflexi bacterium]|nr:PAS domain S-box protein [Chloroflexota bacterium]
AEQNLFNTNIDLSNTVEQLDLALEELKGYRTELEMQNDELRQSQELVETTRARYFELYDLAPVGYCTISEKGLILEANLTAANLLGVPKTAIIKKPFSLFVVKEHQNIYYLKRKKLIEADSSQAFELQMLKKDGTSFWARLETSAALDINGAPMIRVTISDITEQKQADDRLRESEERYRILFQKANVGIIYLSTDLSVEMVNEAFAKMHGYSVEEMSGMRLQDLDTNKNTLLISDRMRRIVSGEVIEFEVEHYHKDGHTFQLAVSANMVSVGGGNIVQAFHRDITEQKRAEVQVNEQLKELSCLNDVSRLVFDPELTEAELCQQVAERLIGALGFPDIATAMVELNGQCYQTAQCTNLHFARLTAPILHNTQKCGQISVCYSEDNSFILPEEQNLLDNIVNILGLWRERKVSDQDVRKLSQAVEQRPVALTGYSLDEIAGKNPRILQTGYTSKAEYQQLWETILSGKTLVGKLLNRKKNGDIYWEKASIAPMFDETGKIAHFMAVKEDITAQKTMEGNLRQSESHNRALLSAIPDMILRLSREGIILDYKANLNGLPGQAHKKIGKSVFEFLDETVAVKVKDHIDQTLRSRQMQSMEINIKIRDIVHVLEVRLKDLGDHEVVAIVRDISEQSRLEQMKSDFINRASHELRTPITTMLLMVSLLDETINKDGNNEFWDVLKSEINHERLLVEHLLRAGRLEGDQEQMSFRSIEIDELIQQVVHDLNPAAREKDITLSVETIPAADGSPRLVHADQNALTQVFVNLVGNAIKFTPRGGKVCICTQSEELGTQISISDTGLGIPSKDLPLLFNRFFRGSNAIDEEIQGTGLGLFIVRSILEKHDGNIRVTSELGKGSQFNVWLPDSQEQFSFPLNPNTYQAQME